MSSLIASNQRPDALDILVREIDSAKKERRPTSRHHLAEVIASETGLGFRDALAEVEAYCEQQEPAIPEYLSSEFAIFWLKVLSVVNAVAGVFVAYRGMLAFRLERPAWPLWCLATIFCGVAAFLWVRSIEAESDRRTSSS